MLHTTLTSLQRNDTLEIFDRASYARLISLLMPTIDSRCWIDQIAINSVADLSLQSFLRSKTCSISLCWCSCKLRRERNRCSLLRLVHIRCCRANVDRPTDTCEVATLWGLALVVRCWWCRWAYRDILLTNASNRILSLLDHCGWAVFWGLWKDKHILCLHRDSLLMVIVIAVLVLVRIIRLHLRVKLQAACRLCWRKAS